MKITSETIKAWLLNGKIKMGIIEGCVTACIDGFCFWIDLKDNSVYTLDKLINFIVKALNDEPVKKLPDDDLDNEGELTESEFCASDLFKNLQDDEDEGRCAKENPKKLNYNKLIEKLMENLMEIVSMYEDLAREYPELTDIGSIIWKEKFTDWANEFEMENGSTDWMEEDYIESIRNFAKNKIMRYYADNCPMDRGAFKKIVKENKPFYTESWCDEDIEDALAAEGIDPDPEKIREMRALVSSCFSDLSERNEMIREIARTHLG